MIGALPATKFAFPPQQAAIVPRPRLLRALEAGTRRPLTLLAAPPGAGKTVLIGSWVAAGRAPGPVAWLSLDAADADRARFWRAVHEAIRQAGVAAPAAHPEQSVSQTVDVLAGVLAEREQPLVLVLDDFQEVGESVHPDLDRLLRHPPAALRIVLATRVDPPLHLARLRLEDHLSELRAPELAFTLAEAGEMMAAHGIEMDAGHLRRLWEHTEGWVGALRLAALSLREHPEPERFVDDFAGDDRAVSDYLISEVLATLSPDDRRFVLRTSVADVVNGELADALTGEADGHRRLSDLSRRGALVALDRRREWYRYHALLRELLRAELRSEQPDRLAELHRRAASWLAARGDDARALRHAVDGEAWDLAARLAGERWADLMIRGEIGALRPLVDRLPDGWSTADPELGLAVAAAQLDRGDQAAAVRVLELARRAADRTPAERRARFDVSLAALDLYVARLRGDLEAALSTGRELAASGALEAAAIGGDLRAFALGNLGIAELWAGDWEAAAAHLEGARGTAAEAGHDWLVLMATAHLALLAGLRDEHPRAARLAREAAALARTRGWERTWPAGGAYLALSTAEFLGDRFDAAARAVEAAHEALSDARERPLRAGLALMRAAVLRAHGKPDTALAILAAGAEELGAWPLLPAIREHFVVREAALRAELGDQQHAVRLLRGDDGAGPHSLAAATVLARLQLGHGDAVAARSTLAGWTAELDRERSPASVQGWLIDALALDAQGDQDGATTSLERCLDRAEPGGLRWAVLSFGRSIQPLLQRQVRRGTAHRALVAELLGALESSDGRSSSRSRLVTEPLSPRERAVLRFLPTMMSNQEIAAELFVSVNTVKTHLKAIYRKLDVADRRQAVRRARALELLAP